MGISHKSQCISYQYYKMKYDITSQRVKWDIEGEGLIEK